MKRFELLSAPLSGSHLIEASAGTGKTFAIAHLFLRLLLEKRLQVKEIMVVTFTEAATEELRGRVRALIRTAHDSAEASERLAEPLRSIVAGQEAPHVRRCLDAALRSFDEAPICTIHGFCQRVLKDNAFESGVRFDSELLTDQRALIRTAAADFLRRRLHGAPPELAAYALHRGVTPDTLAAHVLDAMAHHELTIIPEPRAPDLHQPVQAYRQAHEDAATIWAGDRDAIEKRLRDSSALNRRRYSPRAIESLLAALDWHFAHGQAAAWLFDGFELCTAHCLDESVKKGAVFERHAFFDACERLWERSRTLTALLDQTLLGMKIACIAQAHSRLRDLKELYNVHTFDDLLTKVDKALSAASGRRLAASLRRRFRAGLIDEFQDTDPVQYRIFETLFGQPGSTLYLIGDPKQAIYGFRGADVFTYTAAAKKVAHRHTQDTNYRSAPRLIDAVNTLFSSAQRPFVFDKDIRFLPVHAPDHAPSRTLAIDNQPAPPLTIWFADSRRFSAREKKGIGRGAARGLLCDRVAAEIARLLRLGQTGRATIANTPVSAHDIAVLVSTRGEARQVKQALVAARIPAVLRRAGNVFETREALELERILNAVSLPQDDRLIKAALCTSILGSNGDSLYELTECAPQSFETICEQFRELHDTWRTSGFIRMFNALQTQFAVHQRLLGTVDGERRMTNVRHLAELLQEQSVVNHADIAALCQWLATQRDPASPRLEEHELRLESDEDAVQIVTIHRSKGLEFPIVFCPFLWRDSLADNDSVLFHDTVHNGALTRDYGSTRIEENRKRAQTENLAENVRLMYVALTRAKSRCYCGWGRFNQTDSAAPAYLFHAPPDLDSADPAGALARFMQKADDEAMLADLRRLARACPGGIAVEPLEPVNIDSVTIDSCESAAALQPRRFQRTVGQDWRLISFTALAHGSAAGSDPLDRDVFPYANARDAAAPADDDRRSMHAFPRGARAGTFFHECIEQWDFAEQNRESIGKRVAEALTRHRFDTVWTDTVCDMLLMLADTRLQAHDGRDFCLRNIASDRRLNEVEFYYPISTVTPSRLRDCFRSGAAPATLPERLGALTFRPAAGFMRGFIDCVFEHHGRYYLIDWKSNFLGEDTGAYSAANIAGAMIDNLYHLQYLLYTLALDLYLESRLPSYEYDAHFGGVYYLFLRGLHNRETHGVYADRPPRNLIGALRAALTDRGTARGTPAPTTASAEGARKL